MCFANGSEIGLRHFTQHFEDNFQNTKQTPVQYLCNTYKVPMQEAHALLGKFGLAKLAHKIELEKCSGGEKARVVIASLTLQKPHILILDEPTNHLDMETIEGLIEGLNDFEGAIVIVSHDAELIVEGNFKLWVCDDKTVTVYKGDFEDYNKQVLESLEASI